MRTPSLLLLLVLAGCSSTATRFWTIEPIPAAAPAPGRAITPIQIAAVHVPPAIDRLEIVRHDQANRITVEDFDRWSAPPGDLLRRALTQDLVPQLPPGSVIFPDAAAPVGTRLISVDVLDLRHSGDMFAMQVSWSLAGPAAVPHQLRLQAPAGAGDVAAQAEALSKMTADLAAAIAESL